MARHFRPGGKDKMHGDSYERQSSGLRFVPLCVVLWIPGALMVVWPPTGRDLSRNEPASVYCWGRRRRRPRRYENSTWRCLTAVCSASLNLFSLFCVVCVGQVLVDISIGCGGDGFSETGVGHGPDAFSR